MKEESTTEDDSQKNKDKEGKYTGIPQHLLHCFVCSKDMWDGESFQKHVRGKYVIQSFSIFPPLRAT